MRVLLAGGGTLGSVTPVLAVVQELCKRDSGVELLWVGTKRGPERKLVERFGVEFKVITSGRLRRWLTWQNLVLPFRILWGLFDSLLVLHNWRPDVVFHAGSFVAVPVTWAAWLLRIPVHIHQLDWRPGLANRLSAPFATSVSVSFKKSLHDFYSQRTVLTGNPIRIEILKAAKENSYELFGLSANRPIVLVLGGGTGAAALNQLIVETLPFLRSDFQVMHITGLNKMVQPPNWIGMYLQFDFLNERMPSALAVADLVVTRAGMGTLTELAALGRPAVIVPMPGTHQEDNAELFVQADAAVRFSQNSSAVDLAKLISSICSDREQLGSLSLAMHKLSNPQATELVTDLVLAAVHHRRQSDR
ncbi:undecaprenyldiphospho-muramoylpentapeptide beta-N-acetylglucosaminyltransferase [Candidatus Uhrbacteria bacterium RIFOXYC2_FULL_47_19]|uniref:UDP-N-acetylglucosamine--N-acetylmuramyl-(pentapeptide) pyrophosphoryl-undecaprenol N-acetylglucosamine transferase n=1 Tax=Candidatus Uhrbacteria bacterium RIFOXYC2_FULL_47_19 TaxID=1802424 RepID=A0A1F7WDC9_9BACT|nr:MAG: undecaprenyldiphospho-muramoylpentapeptide beta-N-acetylglucosaminyltransferase [Candidatus Uhrbacteria bacterium RIFOXYC2_FULL_47_19]